MTTVEKYRRLCDLGLKVLMVVELRWCPTNNWVVRINDGDKSLIFFNDDLDKSIDEAIYYLTKHIFSTCDEEDKNLARDLESDLGIHIHGINS